MAAEPAGSPERLATQKQKDKLFKIFQLFYSDRIFQSSAAMND